jgi:hypothetical protein
MTAESSRRLELGDRWLQAVCWDNADALFTPDATGCSHRTRQDVHTGRDGLITPDATG